SDSLRDRPPAAASGDRLGGCLPVGARSEEGRRFTLRWAQRDIDIGGLVSFDAAADAVQIKVEGGGLGVGLDDFADPARVKQQRVFARQDAAALPAQFAAEIAALQRMHLFLNEGEVELQDVVQEAHRLDAGGLGAAKDRLDVVG